MYRTVVEPADLILEALTHQIPVHLIVGNVPDLMYVDLSVLSVAVDRYNSSLPQTKGPTRRTSPFADVHFCFYYLDGRRWTLGMYLASLPACCSVSKRRPV